MLYRPRLSTTKVLLASTLLLGCTANDGVRDHSFQVITEDGIQVALNSGGPKFSGELFRYEPILQLLGDEKDPDSLLNRPESFTVGPAGSLYVADTRNHRVAVFGPNGRFARSFGQQGDGPGDLSGPMWIREMDGMLEIHDSRLGVSRFSLDGDFIDRVSRGASGSPHYGSDGYRVTIATPMKQDDNRQIQAWARVMSSRGDTIAVVTTPWIQIAENVEVTLFNGRRRTMPRVISYGNWPQIEHVPGKGLLVSTGLEAELVWRGYDGSVQRRIRLERDAGPVSELDKKLVRERVDEMMNLEQTNPDRLPFRIDPADLPFAEQKAPWVALDVDDHGYIWLTESQPDPAFATPETRTSEVMLLSPEGEFLGMSTRPNVEEGRVERGHFLAMVRDRESDAVIPTVYRMIPAAKGFKYPE